MSVITLIRLLVALNRRNLSQAARIVRNYIIVKGLLTSAQIDEQQEELLADPNSDFSEAELKQHYEEFKRLIAPFGGTVPFI